MDVDEARTVLGLGPAEGWEAVRPAYRRLIRELHPDRAGAKSTGRAARINEAYAVLIRAKRAQAAGAGAPARGRPPSPSRPPSSWSDGPPLDGADTVLLAMPLNEAFARLLAAGDRVGEISYVDRSSSIFEVIVQHGGEACSLLVTLEPRLRAPGSESEGTEVLFVLEVLGRVASLSPTPVVRRMLAAFRDHRP